jgi:hypothetical protein
MPAIDESLESWQEKRKLRTNVRVASRRTGLGAHDRFRKG